MKTHRFRFLWKIFVCLTLALGVPVATAQTSNPPRDTIKDALGVYSGPFGANTITIRLAKIDGKTASGYSEVGKNRRPFSGSVTMRDGIPRFDVREPGDSPEDGVFRFQYSPEQQALAGTWAPNNKKLAEIKFSALKSGKSARDAEPTSVGAVRGDTPAGSQQWTEGTIVGNVGPDKKHSYVVIKDAGGREHQFIVLNSYLGLTPFLTGPEYYVGKRKRVHWDFETHPDTGQKVKAALDMSDVGSDVYVPAKGSAEREAIFDAVRAYCLKRFKKRTNIKVETIKVENGWAGVSGPVTDANDKNGSALISVAILRRSGSTWAVVGTDAGMEEARNEPRKRGSEDSSRPQLDEWKRLEREYPDAPESIVGLLDYP